MGVLDLFKLDGKVALVDGGGPMFFCLQEMT